MEEKKNIDPIKTLNILAELWAHQNGLTVNKVIITKKEGKAS